MSDVTPLEGADPHATAGGDTSGFYAAEGPSLLFQLNADESDLEPYVPESWFKPYQPRRIGPFTDRFHALVARLAEVSEHDAARALVEEELRWAQQLAAGFEDEAPHPLHRYQAAVSVLADLLAQEWVWRCRAHRLELAPPNFTSAPSRPADVARQKAAIRHAMQYERVAQLQPGSVRRFLADMERTVDGNGRSKRSVLELVADGDALGRELRDAARRSGEDYIEALRAITSPYLQLAEGNKRCAFTNHRLLDIWRYFRYYWSIPWFSTPGRNLFYLVRDGARPLHPIIGIAALGNSMVRLADREQRIGWHVSWIERELNKAAGAKRSSLAARMARHLYDTVLAEITAINSQGIVTADDLAAPTHELVVDLVDRSRQSAAKRRDALRQHEQALRAALEPPRRTRPMDPQLLADSAQVHSLADESVEHLYDGKRTSLLAELISAQMAFEDAGVASDPARALEAMLSSERGCRAITTAITTIKKRHIGTSLMDIIICGAIPPYNHLLGGKLVCMLLTSSQVRLDYRARYAGVPVGITSKMHGEEVAKPAELVFLGTTSLYHVGSSQYNRVRIPAEEAGGSGGGEVRYERLGSTQGYGAVHFSARTRDFLEQAVRDDKGATFITRTFGEGVNSKLRMMREGLATISVDQDHFLRHRCRRIIYGVDLASNAGEFLRDEKHRPQYLLPGGSAPAGRRCTQAIADYWIRRWLSKRAMSVEVLHRVVTTSPEELRVSAEAARGEKNGAGLTNGARLNLRPGPARTRDGGGPPVPPSPPPPDPGGMGVAFIQQLYNHRSCYADRLTEAQLAAIHVETPLERFIVETLRAGKDVVLTGNPGDGKTHVIMRLAAAMEELGAERHADATAEDSYEAIVDIWRRARRRRKPFCLAINEWPLLELVGDHAGSFAPLRELRDQIEGGVVYDDDEPPAERVVLVDLNNRNLVHPEVLDHLLRTLIDERFYPECVPCPAQATCDVPKARAALAEALVRQRLFTLLQLVTKRGHHVTMRDLQGFIAFLITGGRRCPDLIHAERPSPYYSLAFEGESDLFDAIRETFDPARVTHPRIDEALWLGGLAPDGWTALGGPPVPPSAGPHDPIEAMRAVKRRFYFEHADGAVLTTILPQDERVFYEALDAAGRRGEHVIRGLVRLINRFFDPRDHSDGALRLWSRHRFDARWSPTYVSTRTIPINAFYLEVPRLPLATSVAHSYQPDHVVLVSRAQGRRVAQLLVDLPLYRTLFDAQRGLPLALRSAEVLKRLDLFFNALGRANQDAREIEDVHIKNFETGEELRFKVDRQRMRYSL